MALLAMISSHLSQKAYATIINIAFLILTLLVIALIMWVVVTVRKRKNDGVVPSDLQRQLDIARRNGIAQRTLPDGERLPARIRVRLGLLAGEEAVLRDEAVWRNGKRVRFMEGFVEMRGSFDGLVD